MSHHWTEPKKDARLRIVRTIEYIGTEIWLANVLDKSLQLGHPLFLPNGMMVRVVSEHKTEIREGQPTEINFEANITHG